MPAFERLDVYRVAVEFDELMTSALRGRHDNDVWQFARARGSVRANIAEAAVQPPGPNKRLKFRIALGEAAESLTFLDRLHSRGALPRLVYNQGRSLNRRILRMLSTLAGLRPPSP